MASALSVVGCGTLNAKIVRRAVVIGEGAGFRSRAIIVRVADRVRQPIGITMPMVVPARLGRARDHGQCSQGGSGEGELAVESSGISERSEPRHSRPKQVPIQRESRKTRQKTVAKAGISALPACLTIFKHSLARVVPSDPLLPAIFRTYRHLPDGLMRITPFASLLLLCLAASPARADLHITRDHGGYVEEYKAKYARIRDHHERVIIDGICNSACTLVFGIVPMNKICVTPRASLGFHQAYYDKAFTFGIKVTSTEGTSDLMSYYPDTVKDWIRRNGGLTTEMKKIKNGIGTLEDRRSLSGRVVIAVPVDRCASRQIDRPRHHRHATSADIGRGHDAVFLLGFGLQQTWTSHLDALRDVFCQLQISLRPQACQKPDQRDIRAAGRGVFGDAVMRREHARANVEIALGNLRVDEEARHGLLGDFAFENVGARAGRGELVAALQLGENERRAAGGDAGPVMSRFDVVHRQRAGGCDQLSRDFRARPSAAAVRRDVRRSPSGRP